MSKIYKRVFRIFLGWQDEEEEKWLQKMSRKGMHFIKYNILYYTFEVGNPEEYIYKIDYKSTDRADMEEYLEIFKEAGWEHICSFMSWQYFKIEKEKANLKDIYTDNSSKVEKYNGYLKTLKIVTLGEIILFLSVLFNSNNEVFLKILIGSVVTLLVYTTLKVAKKISKLSKGL